MLLLRKSSVLQGEEQNDEDFSRALADGIDVYINDAFGAAHRAQTSVGGRWRLLWLR